MEFYIHSDKYFLREEENRAFTVMDRTTNQTLEFERAMRPLLSATDKWVDFDSFARILQMTGFAGGKIRDRLEQAVFSLYAVGLAELRDVPSFGGTGIRWATLRDVYALSRFCLQNFDKGRSCTVTLRSSYYSSIKIYYRLKQGEEYFLLKEEGGQIRAVALLGLSYRYFGSRVLELRSLIFADDMEDSACMQAVSELARFARAALKGKVRKLRYEYTNPRQAFIVDAVKEAGFRETACFRHELKNGGDLVLLDLD